MKQVYYACRNTNLISLCSNSKSLRQTKQSHAITILNGLLPASVSLSASLILTYATHDDPATSLTLFEQTIPYCSNAFLWNTLIRALSISRFRNEFSIYNRMVKAGIKPDDYTFPLLLKACTDNSEVQKGMEIHGSVMKYGFDLDVFVGNTLLSFYGNCGDLSDARKLFDEMLDRDVVSWNTLIGVFSLKRFDLDAVELFREMHMRPEFKPNMVSVVSVLPVCAELEYRAMTRQIHCYVVKVGLDLLVMIGNGLIDTYGKCRDVEASKQVFDEMVERNEVSWNTIISCLGSFGCGNDALSTFRHMIYVGVKPDVITVSSIIPVLVESGCLKLGKEIHGVSLRMGIESSDVFISNSLIHMYSKAGRPTEASNVFCKMVTKDVVTWSAMVANFAQNGLELAAIELVREMQNHGKTPDSVTYTNLLPACARAGFLRQGKEIHAKIIRTFLLDLFVSNALMDMYAKCDCLSLSRKIFNISFRDEVSYNILIAGYSQSSEPEQSLTLFSKMGLLKMKYDIVSFVGVISACANLAVIKQGKEIHGLSLRKHFYTRLFVANSLLDLYTKCGRIDIAKNIFDHIQDKDAASWNTMILGYAMLGELDVAFNLFKAMGKDKDKVEYDSVSYIAVLSACSHGGLVEKGRKYFEDMKAQNIKPTDMHYACMVDLFGRAGLMDEAVELIRTLPIVPSADIWGALLGACRIHGDIELGRWAAENLFKLKPQHSGYYIVLSNMYAEAGKWEEANKVRELMKSVGAKKNPGCSWVQVCGEEHADALRERRERLGNPMLAEGTAENKSRCYGLGCF